MRKILKQISLIISIFLVSFNLQAQGLADVVNSSSAQEENPVTWSSKVNKISDGVYEIVFKAQAKTNWHFYSQYSEGTMPMAFYFDDIKGYNLKGDVSESPKPKEEYDDVLGGLTKYWDDKATFKQKIEVNTTDEVHVHGAVEYQACINGACMPLTYNFSLNFKGTTKTVASTEQINNQQDNTEGTPEEMDDPEPATEESTAPSEESTPAIEIGDDDYIKLIWEPVIEELSAYENLNSIANKGMWMIFFLGFLGGLVALMTPCVWPMIPMTVSFFIKKDAAKGKRDAIIYGLSIIGIYMALGLGVTGIFGADALNALSTSAVFNIIFFLLLVVFAISFFGAFEIQLPTKWTNKMDQKADSTSGLLSIFFMAFTLVLVSFSCTGPIIGTLLVEAVTKGGWGPAMGMLGFSVALALPFTLFAIFPSMMKNLPKSGGWLNTVKVVLAFLELALALKFLSVADMAYHWGILDREVFLVLWIVIFALLGIYLLGKLRFAHDSVVEKVSVLRTFLAIISLSFALYMIPGLWGAPLKAISAFSPPINTQDFNLYDGTVHAKFENYEEGMMYAKKHNKPVIVDFTGWGCVNCRNMELAVWSDPRVKEKLENDYVLISLFVDDKKPLPKELQRVSEFSGNRLRSVGNLWSDLQISKFGQSSQPYYFALDNKGKPLTGPTAYELDVDKFLLFLDNGLKEYKERKNK
jgi:thiol:disulfide interchange protein